ncbi:MAG: PaeR7I family type II restriction endonuclease, partial [Gemmatales bacterium]|nr:PaeR7I family type II restriction endonuclease [Gemmatales bacterium]MDW8386849.1 PaeR7I family type II restriction endonuclease [Gemmatales bacterium]
ETSIYRRSGVELPGYFRPEKKWDIVIIVNGRLLGALEFKAQVGPSFGNNYNNRSEEALGSATDYWTAYREGAFGRSPKPWLGYLMVLEDVADCRRPVGVNEPHFPVFAEFREASYAKRYELLLCKMVRERLYDAACLLMTPRSAAKTGAFAEPSAELSFVNFVESLLARILAHLRTRF